MKNLLLLLVMALVLAFSAWSQADEPTEPCALVAYLDEQIEGCKETIAELSAVADQYCAEPALARECARQRIEVNAWKRELRELQRRRAQSARRCKH